MRVVVAGHVYELHNVDATSEADDSQTIEFVRRRDADGELMPEEDRKPGILCQELLRVLIDRVLYLYAEAPCEEDTEIIEALRLALVRFESRAARRSIEKISKPELAQMCPVCQHLLCRCDP
jgi:hypothetical protein